ncbi:MAG: hypothetical protein RSB59_06790 [Clostridia bacterium]
MMSSCLPRYKKNRHSKARNDEERYKKDIDLSSSASTKMFTVSHLLSLE